MTERTESNGTPTYFILLLIAATFVVYLPAVRAGYVWDDNVHLLDNPVLNPGGLARAWIPGTYINYWPLTFSTYWLEDRLWGVAHPAGFHLVNISLHAACALLVWRVLRQLFASGANASANSWAPLVGAGVFALHPVNVESVAWVTQLKNVLALLLALSALSLYLRSERNRRWQLYVVSIAAFGLSTLAKGIGLMLPVVLLALAWWQRGRIERRDVWRSIPFVVIGAVMACIEVVMQKEGQPWEVPRTDGMLSRLAGAGWCVWFYLGKVIWPLDLSFVYPRWTIDGGKLLSFVPDVLLLAAISVAWFGRHRWGRGPFVALICYVALLLPVLGFTNIYFMRYSLVADHWQYAAMIVPAAALGAAVEAVRRIRHRVAVTAATTAILVCLGALTYAQAGVYADEETLWRDVLTRNPDSWMAHHNFGNWLAKHGRPQEAVTQYEAVVRLKSDDFQAHNNLGVVLSRMGRSADALASFERALALNADYAVARQNVVAEHKSLGRRLLGEHDYEAARGHYARVLQLAPDDGEGHYGLGAIEIESGDVTEGVRELQRAVTLDENLVRAHDLLARTLATRSPEEGGDPKRALQAALDACALTRYADPSRLDTLAIAYAAVGRFDDAVTTEDQALEIVRRSGAESQASTLHAHRQLFRADRPYRESK